jgi:hypothetical protein
MHYGRPGRASTPPYRAKRRIPVCPGPPWCWYAGPVLCRCRRYGDCCRSLRHSDHAEPYLCTRCSLHPAIPPGSGHDPTQGLAGLRSTRRQQQVSRRIGILVTGGEDRQGPGVFAPPIVPPCDGRFDGALLAIGVAVAISMWRSDCRFGCSVGRRAWRRLSCIARCPPVCMLSRAVPLSPARSKTCWSVFPQR